MIYNQLRILISFVIDYLLSICLIYYIKDYKGGISQIHIDIYACIDKQADPIEEEARVWLKDNIQNLDSYKVTVSYCK